MKIGGYELRDYLRLLAPSFALIASVWVLRLGLDLAGAPRGLVRAFSVTVAGAVAILLAVLLIHARRFGSYANVAFASLLLVLWEQLLIDFAIALSVLTHESNIFTAPEYSGHGMSPLQHILGHLTFGLVLGTAFGTAMGCLLLWMLRRMVPAGSNRKA